MRQTCPVLFQNSSGDSFRIRPEADTAKVFEMELPRCVPLSVWPQPGMYPNALPIEKMVVAYSSTESSMEITHYPRRPFWRHNASFARAPAQQPLEPPTLLRLRQVTLGFTRAFSDWWISGKNQVFGPEVPSRPDLWGGVCMWYRALGMVVGSNLCESGLDCFESKGIVGNDSIRWKVDSEDTPDGTLWENRVLEALETHMPLHHRNRR